MAMSVVVIDPAYMTCAFVTSWGLSLSATCSAKSDSISEMLCLMAASAVDLAVDSAVMRESTDESFAETVVEMLYGMSAPDNVTSPVYPFTDFTIWLGKSDMS